MNGQKRRLKFFTSTSTLNKSRQERMVLVTWRFEIILAHKILQQKISHQGNKSHSNIKSIHANQTKVTSKEKIRQPDQIICILYFPSHYYLTGCGSPNNHSYPNKSIFFFLFFFRIYSFFVKIQQFHWVAFRKLNSNANAQKLKKKIPHQKKLRDI